MGSNPTPGALKRCRSYSHMSGVDVVEVPIPTEIKRLARERGISQEKLVEAVRRLLILDALAVQSALSMEDALKLAKKVDRAAWARLQ